MPNALDLISAVTATVEPEGDSAINSFLKWVKPKLRVPYKQHRHSLVCGPIELSLIEYGGDHTILEAALYVASTLLYSREFSAEHTKNMYKSSPAFQATAQRSVEKICDDFNNLSSCKTDTDLAKLAYDKSMGRVPSQWLTEIRKWRIEHKARVN